MVFACAASAGIHTFKTRSTSATPSCALLRTGRRRQHAADPHFLSRAAARQMMKVHLNQVIEQAVDELKGNYAMVAGRR